MNESAPFNSVVTVPQTGHALTAPVAGIGRLGELAKALASAQQRCRAVAKDARNKYHGYDYASAEAIITEARAALAESGLAFVPVEQSLNVYHSGGTDHYEIVRKFLLAHSSGEVVPLLVTWPVVPDKGRPIDKAMAIACTSSLAYALRDLLLMPRVSADDDMAARQDREQTAGTANGRPAAPASAAAPQTKPTASTDQLTQMRDLRRDLAIADDQWAGILTKRGVSSARELSPEKAQELIAALSHRANCRMLEDAIRQDDAVTTTVDLFDHSPKKKEDEDAAAAAAKSAS